jgi:hypothetical protein
VRCSPMKVSDLLKFNIHFSTSYTEARPIVSGFMFLCLLFSGSGLFAQKRGGRFQLETGLHISPVRNLLKDTGTYGNQSAYFSVYIPVFKQVWKSDEKTKVLSFFFSDQFSYQSHELSRLQSLVRLYQNQSRLSASYFPGKKGFWMASLGANLIGDSRHPESSLVLPSGSVLYKRRVNRIWAYTVGFGYNFLFGQGLGLPIAGFSYRLKPAHQLSFVLPFSATYRIRHASGVQSLIQLRPAGNIGQLYIAQFPKGQPARALFFRSRAYSAGYQGLFPVGDRLRIRAGVSLLFRRKIWISDALKGNLGAQQNAYTASVRSGLLIEIGLRYIFRKKSNRNSPSSNPDNAQLDDEDLRDIDFSDFNFNDSGNTH